MAACHLRLDPSAVRLRVALVCHRNVHAFFLWPRSGTVHRPARIYLALRASIIGAGVNSDAVGIDHSHRTGRIRRAALCCFCGVRYALSERSILPPDPGEMDLRDSGGDLDLE